MPNEIVISFSTLLSFLLVMTRIGGVFTFVPIPGAQAGAPMSRITLVLCLTLSLYSQWPKVPDDFSPGLAVLWMVQEAAFGVTIGLAVSFITEVFLVAAQTWGLQAGYTFASTLDPITQADATILLVFSQLLSGLLFFVTGLHHDVLRAFTASLSTFPPGAAVIGPGVVQAILLLGSAVFSTALRLALPVIALLLMIDVALALMGRINSQLQLLSLAFPLKMLATLVMLSWLLLVVPKIYRTYSLDVLNMMRRFAGF